MAYQAQLDAFRAVGHPNGEISALTRLATLSHTAGDSMKAEPLYLQCLEIQKTVFGEEHPDYATTLHSLADCWLRAEQYAKAEEAARRR